MAQTGEISFAARIAYNIKGDEAKQRILEELESKFRFKVIQKHFEGYSDAALPKLQNNPHLVSLRTNGNPYLLYLTKMGFVNQCVFIDKKVQQGYFLPRIILTKFRFHNDLFEGTLFDGEMIKDANNEWIFMISDVIAHRGGYLDNVNLVKRLNMLYGIVKDQYIYDENDVCHFQVKRYFTYDQIDHLVSEFVPKLPYTCRGLYFKPLFLKFRDILFNFDDTLIQKVLRKKYKNAGNFLMMEDKERLALDHPIERKSVDLPRVPAVPVSVPAIGATKENGDARTDTETVGERRFYIKKTSQPDVFELFDRENKPCGTACVPTLKISKMMRALFADKNVTDKVLMRCEHSAKFDKYIPTSVVSGGD